MNSVTEQYKTSTNLNSRANLHRRYASKNWFRWVGERTGFTAGDQILDVGCGTGWFWEANESCLPEGLKVSLLDQSEAMVSEARTRLRQLPILGEVTGHVERAEALPFPENSFDVVMAMHVIYHLTDPVKALDEMLRVLKPEGTLLITINSNSNLREIYEFNSRVFDVEPCDPSTLLAPPEEVAAHLRQHFSSVTQLTYDDIYAIDDAKVVFSTLTSYPPGNEASEEQKTELLDVIEQGLAQAGGILRSPHEVLLYVAEAPQKDLAYRSSSSVR